jgi:hypothetical protein
MGAVLGDDLGPTLGVTLGPADETGQSLRGTGELLGSTRRGNFAKSWVRRLRRRPGEG